MDPKMFDLLVKIQKNSNDPRVRAILGQLNVNQRGGGTMRSPQGPPITTIGTFTVYQFGLKIN